MSVGIRRIAERLGVAPSSVSRALTDKPGVSAGLRKKILAAADGLAYSPNPIASSLRTGKGQGVVLIVSIAPTTIAASRNRALVEMAQAQFSGARIHVAAQGETLDETVRISLGWSPCAIVSTLSGVISDKTAALLKEKRVPLSAMDAEIPGHDAVAIDRVNGVYQAIRLILLSNCLHPVLLTTATLACPDTRIDGARLAFESLGQRLEEEHLHQINFYSGAPLAIGHDVAKDILRTRPVDAIFCYSDEIAVGVLRALLSAGVRVPDDVLVIGFDGLPIAEYLTPSLTTVSQPVEDVAKAALDLCAGRILMPDEPPRRVVLSTRLVVRESAPARNAAVRNEIFSTIRRDD